MKISGCFPRRLRNCLNSNDVYLRPPGGYYSSGICRIIYNENRHHHLQIESLHPSLPSSNLDHKAPTSPTFTVCCELAHQDIISMKFATCKTCEADPIPAMLLKSSIRNLAHILRKRINTSKQPVNFIP